MNTDFAEALVEELQKDNLLDTSKKAENEKSNSVKTVLEPVKNEKADKTNVKPENLSNGVNTKTETAEKSPEKSKNEQFQQKISKEITSLQTVEQILFGVEREQLKVTSSPFDTLKLNKTLHDYQKIDPESLQVVNLETVIQKELENWQSHLTERDKKVALKDLRLYCETTKPALSAKAVITLAQFYRKNCHDEIAYRKFELLFTRVFTAESENEKRELVCEMEDITKHLTEIFAKWEVKNPDVDVVNLSKLETLGKEFNNHESFSSFLVDEFFTRYQTLKHEIGENIFEPKLLTKIIDYNIAFANKFVALVAKEKSLCSEKDFEEKKNFIACYESPVSDAIGKTLFLENIKKESFQPVKPKVSVPTTTQETQKKKAKSVVKQKKVSAPAISKWLVAACLGLVFAFGAFYLFVEYGMGEKKVSSQVKSVPVENLPGGENLKVAKVYQQKMSAVVKSDWSVLTMENKKKILSDVLTQGEQKGYNTVDFLDSEGKRVGFASKEKIEVFF